MKFLRLLLIAYANLYHFAVTILLGGIGFVSWSSGTTNVKLDMLPWTGEELVAWLLRISAIGAVACLLHITGKFPYLLVLSSFALAFLMVRGFFWLPYQFSDLTQFYWVIGLSVGAVGAFLSSLAIFRKPKA
ncbi:MAG: hypothetical protein K2X03_20105 [Bryobacteraceae bacterium]|nr:hypothetical protein [Bryobacteraceae bacterium]